jgi:hypothetical protein
MKQINLSPNRKGDLAEYYAVTWLWDKGYEVFKNAGCTGFVDLIALDPKGNPVLIDVKTFWKGKDTSGSRTEEQKELGVRLLGYDPDTRKLRFVDHKTDGENCDE